MIFGVFDIKFCSSVDNEKFTVKIGSFLSKENRLGVENSYHRGLHYFVLMTTCATFLLIIAGALVTSNDAGLSVPDWPLSYGQLMPEMSGGVFYEHSHRMVAASVGLLTVILNIWLWKIESRSWVCRLGNIALATVIIQGILGGITVLFFLPVQVSVIHASLAQLFFCMLIALSLAISPVYADLMRPLSCLKEIWEQKNWKVRLAVFSTAAIYCQLILGAVLRHSGTVDGTKGAVLVTWALWAHISGAILVTVLVCSAVLVIFKKSTSRVVLYLAYLKISLLLLQLFLGVLAYFVRAGAAYRVQPTIMEVFFVTSHVAVGALLLAVALILALRLLMEKRLLKSSQSVLELQTG